eukprot:SAG11_NODE_12035_length_725_cov_0.870607_1_plen_59_part_01
MGSSSQLGLSAARLWCCCAGAAPSAAGPGAGTISERLCQSLSLGGGGGGGGTMLLLPFK